MGIQYKFQCKSCGYTASVSGGADRGFLSLTQTIVCSDCGALYDVDVGEIGKDDMEMPSKRTATLRCPESRKHKVHEWVWPAPCPKCGSEIERREVEVLWD